MKQQIAKFVRSRQAEKSIQQGMAAFRATGQTPPESYQSLVALHCMTGGRSNDKLHEALAKEFPSYALGTVSGALGTLTPAEAALVAAQVTERGYYVFPNRLPEEICRRIEQFALTTPALLVPQHPGSPESAVYDRSKPLSENYRFDEEAALTQPDIQALAADLSLLAVAQAYLQSQPVLDIVAFWWSTTYSKTASDAAAQLYHFDMDRIKWLKFFFYLTDVTTETGPHCFVAGSHKPGEAAGRLLSRGQVRIPDEDMEAQYPKEAFVEITGPCGSIIAVDTRGFHKGKPLQTGERLLLQFEYADSLFGHNYPAPVVETPAGSPLADAWKKYPRTFSHFAAKP